MYEFESPRHGRCKVEARTSGKHGFGLPKHFVFTSQTGKFTGRYIIWHRNKDVGNVIDLDQRRNVDLLRLAIGQFCQVDTIENEMNDELKLECQFFPGDITNRHGRVISQTSALPRRSSSMSATSCIA